MNKDYVFCRIGMALVSAQRVEFITRQIVEHLSEFDKNTYGIMTPDFLNDKNLNKPNKTLGQIFRLLKLSPNLVIEEVLDDYKNRRNILIHQFWEKYLQKETIEQANIAVEFCNEFGRLSTALESFFKGFLYFLALRHVKDRDHLDADFREWDKDFEFFLYALDNRDSFKSPSI